MEAEAKMIGRVKHNHSPSISGESAEGERRFINALHKYR